jgi:hypothetical protein
MCNRFESYLLGLMISILILSSSCKNESLIKERFILDELEKNKYCFNFNQSHYTDMVTNVNHMLKAQRTYKDEVNDITIEHHVWLTDDYCDENPFYLLEYKDQFYIIPFCDERNLLKNRNLKATHYKFFVEEAINKFLSSTDLKDPKHFSTLFFDSAFFSNDLIRIRDLEFQIKNLERIKSKIKINNKDKNYRYYFPMIGFDAIWEVIINENSIKLNLLNKENYKCFNI